MNAAPSIATSRYLTFEVDGQLYALPADQVTEVMRVPPLARVPQGPAALLGVANLRGAVLPVASLHVMLGVKMPAQMPDTAIVLDAGAPVMLVVDAVARLEAAAVHDIHAQEEAADAPGARFSGAFAIAGSQRVARILDIRPLLDAAFTRRVRNLPEALPHTAQLRLRRELPAAVADQMLVTFEVGGQEFALPLADVQEILPAPAEVTAMARADHAVLGITAVRDRLLPLLSLRALLGFEAATGGERQKVVVMKMGDARVGLVTDRARTILAADASQVDAVPPVLASRTGGESRIRAIYRGDGGRRLVSILDPARIFRNEVMQQLTDGQRGADPADSPRGTDAGGELIFLVFQLGDEEFGLPIDTVVEVAPVPEQITRVPRTPRFLEGVVNLRGEVLPIVDQRRRFEMPPREAGAGRRLVVVRTARHRAGLIVDAVRDVLRTTTSQVSPPPQLTEATSRLIHGVLNIEAKQRLVLLLDPAELLTRAEQGLLDTFQASRKKADA